MALVLPRALFVLALAGLACFPVPTAAEAMTASLVQTGTQTLEWDIHASPDVFERTALYRLEIIAAPGERNDILVRFDNRSGAHIRDAGAPMVAGDGCVVASDGLACLAPKSMPAVIEPTSVDLGDGDDRLEWRGALQADPVGGLPWTQKPVLVRGGPGRDNLIAGFDAPDLVLDGGPDADTMLGGFVTYADRTAPVTVTDDGLANDGEPMEGDAVLAYSLPGTGIVVGVKVTGGSGDDVLEGLFADGGAGDDTITALGWGTGTGGPGNDTLTARSNTQVRLAGGPGNDRVVGGSGNDYVQGNEGADVVRGGEGRDVDEEYAAATGPLRITLDDVADDGRPGERDDIGSDVEDVVGGSGDDLLIGSAAANYLWAGAGGHDRVEGRGGDDQLAATDDDDEVIGGPGRDWISVSRGTAVDARDGEADRIICQTTSTNGVIRFAVDPQDVVQFCKPQIRVSQREFRVSRTGTVALRLDCDYGGPPCSGVARLSLLGSRVPALERRFAFGTGYGGKLVWKLSTTTRRALRARHGHAQALLVIAIDNASEPPKRRRLPVRLPRRHATTTASAGPRSAA